MTKDEAKRIWGEGWIDYPEVQNFIEARLMLTKEEADEARKAASLKEAAEREARRRG